MNCDHLDSGQTIYTWAPAPDQRSPLIGCEPRVLTTAQGAGWSVGSDAGDFLPQ